MIEAERKVGTCRYQNSNFILIQVRISISEEKSHFLIKKTLIRVLPPFCKKMTNCLRNLAGYYR